MASDGLTAYKKLWYQQHRESVLAKAAKRKESLRSYATAEQLVECRGDPRKAFSIAGPEKAVCLECGQLVELIGGPHLKRHGLTDDEYREKWGYNRQTALASLTHKKRLSRVARLSGGVRRMRGKQLPTPERTARLIEARRAAPKRREYRLTIGDSKRGKPRPDLQRSTARDLDIARLRLRGIETEDIGKKLGLTGGSARERLKRIGFPRGRACLYEHGTPVTGQRILDTCTDFGKTKRQLATLLGRHSVWLSKVSAGRYLKKPLSVSVAKQLSGMRKTLSEQSRHMTPTPRGGRPRILADSERAAMRSQYHALYQDMKLLWTWLGEQESRTGLDSVWGWLCEQSRLGRIHTLLFWHQFFDWLNTSYEQGPFLERSWSPQELAYQFLADDFHVRYETVRSIVARN